MTLPDGFATGQSLQSLDQNQQLIAKQGYGVVSGCSVSIYNGTLGSSEATVEVAAGTLLVNGSTVDVASTTLGVPVSDVDPRKDLVVYDTGASALAVVEGQAEDASPTGSARQQARIPRPPSLDASVTAVSGTGDPKIPLAEVWVPADATSITSDDLFDRRQGVEPIVADIDAAERMGIPVYSADADAPNTTLYFNSSDSKTKYKDSSGTVHDAAGDDRTDVSDNGTAVVSDVTDINFGANLAVTDDGDGSTTVDSTATQNTTTTLFMSDYASSGGVVDTEFDQAVSDATAGDTIVFDHNTYELTSSHAISKSLTIDATSDSELVFSNTSNNNAHILFEGGGTGTSTTTTEVATIGQRTIAVNDETIFSAGDRVLFMEDTYGQQVNSRIQFAEIHGTATGEITIMNAVSKELVSGCNVYNVDLIDSPTIQNLSTSGGGWRHFQFQWCEKPTFRNVSISEYLEVSLYTLDSWKPRYYNVVATDPGGTLSGEGEPIASYRCTDGYIESPRVYDCRRGIDFAWGARGFTIVDPVLHGCLIAGISVHQSDEAGIFHIEGGEIVCQSVEEDTAHNGQGISMSPTAETSIDGTRIVARANGIIASGETHATNVVIEPPAGTPDGNAAILIQSSDCSFVGCRVNDPNGLYDNGVWVDASGGSIENVEIDCDMDSSGENMVYVDGRGAAVKNVTVRGNYDLAGASSNQGFLVHSDDSNRVENIDISVTIENHPEQAIRLLADSTNSAGVLDNINIHDCYFGCGQAAVFDDGAGTFETLRVRDCSGDTGSTALSFNDSPNKLFVTNNDMSGSINASGTNQTISGNL